jgi:MFS family permease
MTKALKPFEQVDFRRLFAGVTTSHLGDQFALIATPWLVLQLTGDPLALGLVLALEGAPRAVFMLLGGAVTDRYSPRLVMLVSDILRLILATIMALVVITGIVEIWMVFAFALGFGVIAGFAVPAGQSIVPKVVAKRDLEAGNALVMGGSQLVGFVGPFLAGVVIGQSTATLFGVGLAFAIDAATFAVSALMLWRMRSGGVLLPARGADGETISHAIAAGLAHVWRTTALRTTLLLIAAINFLFVGPITVGIPVLADQRLPEGSVAFGLLLSGFAGGNLVGFVWASAAPRLSGTSLRHVMVALLAGITAVLAVLGVSYNTWVDVAVLAAIGIGNGYVTIALISTIQAGAPEDLLGRIMALVTFASLGLVPVSAALSGAFARLNTPGLFIGASVLMAAVTIWTATQTALQTLCDEIAPAQG